MLDRDPETSPGRVEEIFEERAPEALATLRRLEVECGLQPGEWWAITPARRTFILLAFQLLVRSLREDGPAGEAELTLTQARTEAGRWLGVRPSTLVTALSRIPSGVQSTRNDVL